MHSIVLPKVVCGIEEHILKAIINDNIVHEAIKFDGDLNKKLILYPLNDVRVTRLENLWALSWDPQNTIKK